MADTQKPEQKSGNLSEGTLPTNLSKGIVQQLFPNDTERVRIQKGFVPTNLPMVNLKPLATTDNSNNSENSNNKQK